MKKILLVLLICTIVIAGITAEVVVSNMTKQTELDKQFRDAILSTLPTLTDSKGIPLTKQIKPTIEKYCSEKDCVVKLNQKGLMNDNTIVIDKYKYNCSVINEKEFGQEWEIPEYVCTPILKTDTEIDDEILLKTTEILEEYGKSILQSQEYEKTGEGTIEVIEK